MANRNGDPMYAIEKMVFGLYAKANITNTTGVVASYSGQGIASIARSGAGEYTITLQDGWNDLFAANITVVSATPLDLVAQVDNYSLANKTIVFNTLAGAVPTDSTQDIELLIELKFKNSSVI